MDSISIHQFFAVGTWFGLVVLLFLLALVARKYETLSGERTYYRLFVVPALIFAGSAVRQARQDQGAGDPLGDVFLLAGGVVLGVLCLHMYRLMTSRH